MMTVLNAILRLITSIVVLPFSGWAGAHLWTWFVVPLGVPAITWWHFAGLRTVYVLFTLQLSSDLEMAEEEDFRRANKETEAWRGWRRIVAECVAVAVVLLFGWGFHTVFGS
jgi:hypothetical protein